MASMSEASSWAGGVAAVELGWYRHVSAELAWPRSLGWQLTDSLPSKLAWTRTREVRARYFDDSTPAAIQFSLFYTWPEMDGGLECMCSCDLVRRSVHVNASSTKEVNLVNPILLSKVLRSKCSNYPPKYPPLSSIQWTAELASTAGLLLRGWTKIFLMRPLRVYVGKIFLLAASLSLFMLMSIYLTITIRDNCVNKAQGRAVVWQ